MTIDAILPMMVLPYTINLETKDQDLEQLHQNISLSTEPIISLETLKQTFDIDKYKVQTHSQGEFNSDNIPSHILKKAHVQKILKELNERNGRKYIGLTKDDIKQLFSLELYRDKQLNKIL